MRTKFLKSTFAIAMLFGSFNAICATPTMSWNVATTDEIDELTFGIKINAAAPVNEFYFAYQFGFTDGGAIGYTGIQPTVNAADGSRQFLVLFSSFRDDSEPQYESCSGGADGSSSGVTCRKYIPGELGDTFRFKVIKDNNLMTGIVVNERNQREDVIGKWTVSDDAGSLAHSEISWIENYKMNDPNFQLTCDAEGWPYYEVKFLPPTANNGTLQGTISTLSHGSDACPGAIVWEHDDTGTLVQGGYK